jgi:hypothetical protein
LPVTQIWMRPDPFSSAITASVQLSGWAKGNLKKTCTVVRPLKVPDLLAALVPRVHTIVQLPVMPCLGAAQTPASIETGLFSVAPFGSQRAKSPRELHEPMLRFTVGVAAVLVADADADRAPTERTAAPAMTRPRTLVLMLSPLGSEPDSQLPRSHQKDAVLATSVDARASVVQSRRPRVTSPVPPRDQPASGRRDPGTAARRREAPRDRRPGRRNRPGRGPGRPG